MPELRGRRVGHVPQRPLHRARHQAGSTATLRALALEPDFAVRLDPASGELGVLLEPASVVAKAWEQIERIGGRARWQPRRVLVTGAGPIGLLAALLGRQRGLGRHVLDQVTDGPKPELVADLGATYHTGSIADACTDADIVDRVHRRVGQLVLDAMRHTAPAAIVCLTGVSSGGRRSSSRRRAR